MKLASGNCRLDDVITLIQLNIYLFFCIIFNSHIQRGKYYFYQEVIYFNRILALEQLT